MVEIIEGQNANALFVNTARALLNKGHGNNPRGLETLEICDAWLILRDPTQSLITLPERDLSMEYLKAETDWYLSGDLSVEEIGKHAKIWRNISDADGNVQSNYGYLTMHAQYNGMTQLDWCIDSLKRDNHSRQAVMNYLQPQHKRIGEKDVTCTISQQFVMRDKKLDSIVLMRSNDIWFGFSYDLKWFCDLQERVSQETGIPIGSYNHYASSLHVYKRHFKKLRKVADASL